MSFSERLRVVIDVAADKARSALSGFSGSISDADDKTGKLTGSHKSRMDGFAKATVAGFGVTQVLGFAKQIFETGTALEAMDAKAETVFGSQIGRVRAWADANAGAMGLTQSAAVGAGAAIADLLKPMGFTTEAATEQTLKLLDLSAALAAWSGGKQDAAGVSEILTKAMLGEREQLKALGISITEADVSAKLAEKGQKGLTGATLAQAKALATQELIYAKSTDAQKAWADGSMDATKDANKSKASMAEVGDMLAKSLLPAIQALIPALTSAAELLTELAPAFEFVGDSVSWVTDRVDDLKDVAEELTDIDMLKPDLVGRLSETAFTIGEVTAATVEYGDSQKEAAQESSEFADSQEEVALKTDAARAKIRDADVALQQLKDTLSEEEQVITFKDAWAELLDEIDKTGVLSDATRLKVEGLVLSFGYASKGASFKVAVDSGDIDTADRKVRELLALVAGGIHVDVVANMAVGSELRWLMEGGAGSRGATPTSFDDSRGKK